MTDPEVAPDLLLAGRYYVLASSVAADLPRLVLKLDDAFLVADRRGDFPAIPETEFGFYWGDTRFLSQLEVRIHDQRPIPLQAAVRAEAFQARIDLTNPDVPDGDLPLPGRTLRLARILTLGPRELREELVVESFADGPHAVTLAWHFASDFADVFEVRGFRRPQRGALLAPRCGRDTVVLGYRGLDGVQRRTRLRFAPPPDAVQAHAAHYRLTLPGRGSLSLAVTVTAAVEDRAGPRRGRARSRREWLDRVTTRIRTDHERFNLWLEGADHDLRLLLTDTPDGWIPYAGIPWYAAPFGRDSLITALQVLPFRPEVAAGTLRYLARRQGRREDPFTDQEPGKILHELRQGELAGCRAIPFIPYYGSVDATPLFLVLLAEYVRWTGDLDLARQLWPAALRALDWMAGAGAPAGDGYLRYARRSPLGLDNQGWKDSHDAIMHASGELAPPPIALVEVQGYQYAALLGAADVARWLGDRERSGRLRERAGVLRDRFERDFWMEDEGFYALALDGQNRPCRVVTSNPGHCLWMGAVAPTRAARVARRLMAEDVFSGWGTRTLSTRERRYNPMSYHNGSVWPHDTAIAAVGMRRYGLDEPFTTLATALFQAAMHMEGARLPELFCGFPRQPGYGPTRYPVACSPQAWAAGAVFQLVGAMLGLVPEAPDNRITLHRPVLPPWLAWIEVHGLRLGPSRVDLRLLRGREGAAVELLAREGDVEVVVRR